MPVPRARLPIRMSSRSGISLRIRAFAKINLTLRVLGVHADGYHELRTIFQSLALHDTLTFTSARGPFSIACDDGTIPVDRSNLVWRAAESLWTAARKRGALSGVRVAIRKRIPSQAGLGGGSSDAAATLRALARLWRIDLSADRLHGLARDLGADVAYFLVGGTALGVERGDLLFPLADRARQWVVIVRPAFGVSTKDAYAWWDAEGDAPQPSTGAIDPWIASSELRNDLEPPVVRRHPEIGALVRRLRSLGAGYSAMSGSGSAVFGLFASETSARRAAAGVARPGRLAIVTRTLDRRGYQRG
jgi:4-diphosphocytidyl-2-C-methyl-D-erythritol kinase